MKNICDICGKELKVKIRGRDAINYCEEHGDMLVTTYYNEIEKDYTKYNVVLLPGNICNIDNIKLISIITNTNFVNAKKLLSSNKNELIFKNYSSNINVTSAVVIKDVATRLIKANLKFKIVPDFPHKI